MPGRRRHLGRRRSRPASDLPRPRRRARRCSPVPVPISRTSIPGRSSRSSSIVAISAGMLVELDGSPSFILVVRARRKAEDLPMVHLSGGYPRLLNHSVGRRLCLGRPRRTSPRRSAAITTDPADPRLCRAASGMCRSCSSRSSQVTQAEPVVLRAGLGPAGSAPHGQSGTSRTGAARRRSAPSGSPALEQGGTWTVPSSLSCSQVFSCWSCGRLRRCPALAVLITRVRHPP